MTTPKEYQALIAGGCPYCGEALEIKRGKYGEFIACSEWCGYTKGILGRSFYPPKKVKCSICNGKGLVPSTALGVFSGKPIPNCWTACECVKDESEHYTHITPEDYDFPCSDTFRAFTYQYCDQPDPGYTPPEPIIDPDTRDWETKGKVYVYLRLDRKALELQERIVSLEEEVTEMRATKKKGKYISYKE